MGVRRFNHEVSAAGFNRCRACIRTSRYSSILAEFLDEAGHDGAVQWSSPCEGGIDNRSL
jgi:hypothetical protein